MHENKIVVALVYDFDGTLSPKNMQEFSFIKALGMSAESFWEKVTSISKENDASSILCYMKVMLDEAKAKGISLKQSSFNSFGNEVELFEGVCEWFAVINDYAQKKGIKIQHYINSSGLREMIVGTKIAKEFEKIYACSFLYDVDDIAVWPAVAVDFTTKTQFLFKINKGIDSVFDSQKINEYVPHDKRAIPFKRMIYFGDGQTDIPSMKMVKSNGGHSIAVYTPDDEKKKKNAKKLILEDRVNFVCEANYTKHKDIYTVVTTILDKIKSDYDFDNLLKKHKNLAEKKG